MAPADLTATPLPGPQLPWPAQRRPLSVVAFGNSVASLMLPARLDRGQGTYVEVMSDLLSGQGVPTVPHQESRWFDFLHRAMRDYESRVRVHCPDVVVVNFGLNEYQPWLLPIWVIRTLLVQNQAASRTAKAYRRWVAPRLWKWVRAYRRRAARYVGQRTWQTTPRRFEGQLRRLLRNVRVDGRPLVLVMDIDRPNDKLEHFLPGMQSRHQVFQALIERVVEEQGDTDVRLVRVSEVTAALGDGALADGMHYTSATHHAVGEHLADEVVRWLRERGLR
jgi:lysophospholipase L1-like esterase